MSSASTIPILLLRTEGRGRWDCLGRQGSWWQVQRSSGTPNCLPKIYKHIYSTDTAFAALKADGTVVSWDATYDKDRWLGWWWHGAL